MSVIGFLSKIYFLLKLYIKVSVVSSRLVNLLQINGYVYLPNSYENAIIATFIEYCTTKQ